MHTFHGQKHNILFNSDGSGDVRIVPSNGEPAIEVPCDDLVAFVGELVRRRRISQIESAPAAALVGL
jgi:hypothetical protein